MMFLLCAAAFACHDPFTQCPVSKLVQWRGTLEYELWKQEGHWQTSISVPLVDLKFLSPNLRR
jgi:hypothetical protein